MDDEKLKILSFTAPKNFKSGRLIMGRFRWIDLLILIAGGTFSFLGEIVYVGFLNQTNYLIIFLLIFPAAISFLLTASANVYHNNLLFLKMAIDFVTSNRVYLWEGIYRDEK